MYFLLFFFQKRKRMEFWGNFNTSPYAFTGQALYGFDESEVAYDFYKNRCNISKWRCAMCYSMRTCVVPNYIHGVTTSRKTDIRHLGRLQNLGNPKCLLTKATPLFCFVTVKKRTLLRIIVIALATTTILVNDIYILQTPCHEATWCLGKFTTV